MASVRLFGEILSDRSAPLKKRFRALFALRNIGGLEALQWISINFADDSALLKHELAYCLGQMGDANAIALLTKILADPKAETIVRHEAAEALGAIGSSTSLAFLEKFANESNLELSTTCQLAIGRIKWTEAEKIDKSTRVGKFNSVDPTPPFKDVSDVAKLSEILQNPSETMWRRYQAMFSLRDINNDQSILALGKGLHCGDSVLFRHEVAYVLGQLASPVAFADLKIRLGDTKEDPIVRHECAEALGAIATAETSALLKEFLSDPHRLVRESCEVALDINDYLRGGEFQFSQALLD